MKYLRRCGVESKEEHAGPETHVVKKSNRNHENIRGTSYNQAYMKMDLLMRKPMQYKFTRNIFKMMHLL